MCFKSMKSTLTLLKPTKGKQANISRVPSSISPRPSKSVLAKSKYFKKIQSLNSNNCLYTWAFKDNIKEIIKIKDAFPKLSSNKIIEIHNITSNKGLKGKLKFNMTIQEFSRKQIIISMSTNNSEAIISQANKYMLNINKLLKSVKSDVSFC